MLHSALNFAAGFFGIPYENQYHQLITVEAVGFNNTLAPYMTCPNGNNPALMLTGAKVNQWKSIYLKDAQNRLSKLVSGIDLDIKDVYDLQEMCAYEMVALSGSSFCELFTEKEWEGFEYVLDLAFYYSYSFGQPAQAAMGLGWVQEWISRVSGERITEFNSTTNSSIVTSDTYFPLGTQDIYVDATHDTIISAVLSTLNFNSFAGALPSTHIPEKQNFIVSHISPFAANLHAQMLTCGAKKEKKVRWLLNDGVVPLDGVKGCGTDKDGLCSLETFIASTKESVSHIDWNFDCRMFRITPLMYVR